MRDIYREGGYLDRDDYLGCLADNYGVPLEVVYSIAGTLGVDEDFGELPDYLRVASREEW